MRHVDAQMRVWRLLLLAALVVPAASMAASTCSKPLYLTFDTGHMGVAPLVADVLRRQQVKVTFFGANEATRSGEGSLGGEWASWWRERASEGHAFASHTYDHLYWRSDAKPAPDGMPRFHMRASSGPRAGQDQLVTASEYCQEIGRATHRLEVLTGQPALPVFRAPGGKTSPTLLAVARGCGYVHVGWSPAGFLGDELPSETYPNDALLKKALRDLRPGDVLLAHLGIWSRRDPWAPAVLEPLIVGLKAKGFCFATLREHPQYGPWIANARTYPWIR